jgi:hypothetical protein
MSVLALRRRTRDEPELSDWEPVEWDYPVRMTQRGYWWTEARPAGAAAMAA